MRSYHANTKQLTCSLDDWEENGSLNNEAGSRKYSWKTDNELDEAEDGGWTWGGEDGSDKCLCIIHGTSKVSENGEEEERWCAY